VCAESVSSSLRTQVGAIEITGSELVASVVKLDANTGATIYPVTITCVQEIVAPVSKDPLQLLTDNGGRILEVSFNDILVTSEQQVRSQSGAPNREACTQVL